MGSRPKVYSVAIETTPVCNQKCDYCYNEWREDGGVDFGERDKLLARVQKMIDAWDIDHVTVTGGEPFAHGDVFQLLDLLARHEVGIQIISNGGLIDDALAKRLAPYGVRYVQVTLNGPTRELHEAHVGRGHFDRTLEGVRVLRRQGIPVVGCVVVTRKNAAELGATLELWHSLGIRQIAEQGALMSFVDLMDKNSDQLDMIAHAHAFAWVDYLIATQGGRKFADFLQRLKKQEATRDAMQATFGFGPLQFDERFSTWVKETYPLQKGR